MLVKELIKVLDTLSKDENVNLQLEVNGKLYSARVSSVNQHVDGWRLIMRDLDLSPEIFMDPVTSDVMNRKELNEELLEYDSYEVDAYKYLGRYLADIDAQNELLLEPTEENF